ncbi:MAG: hypothetical protein E5W56_11075 [Mesorhizobium sp.]|nr:MAG: hypothetical protein E5W56_11075 [Mesorhizobium sp.]
MLRRGVFMGTALLIITIIMSDSVGASHITCRRNSPKRSAKLTILPNFGTMPPLPFLPCQLAACLFALGENARLGARN